jgi:ribosomal protein L31
MVMSATHATYIGNKTKINKRMVMPATHATYTGNKTKINKSKNAI